MYGKALFFVVLIVLGAVLPYILAEEDWLANIESRVSGLMDRQASTPSEGNPVPSPDAAPQWKTGSSPQPADAVKLGTVPTGYTNSLEDAWGEGGGQHTASELPRVVGPADVPFEYLLTFQATPEWISAHWSRVSTRLADMDLQGWRVPVAQGVGSYAFAGSITYYFDPHRHVQRIVLHGYAADPAYFVTLATGRYQMKRIPSRMGDLYTATLEGEIVGGFLVQYASVAERSAEKRCELTLELNRRGSIYGKSRNLTQILDRSARDLQLFAPPGSSKST